MWIDGRCPRQLQRSWLCAVHSAGRLNAAAGVASTRKTHAGCALLVVCLAPVTKGCFEIGFFLLLAAPASSGIGVPALNCSLSGISSVPTVLRAVRHRLQLALGLLLRWVEVSGKTNKESASKTNKIKKSSTLPPCPLRAGNKKPATGAGSRSGIGGFSRSKRPCGWMSPSQG